MIETAPIGDCLIPGEERTPGHAMILLPPGLGDIHWTLCKLENFLESRGYIGADAWIWDVGGPRRSAEFLQRIPFINFRGFCNAHPAKRALDRLTRGTETCVKNAWGFDYIVAFNGFLEAGLPMQAALNGCDTNWSYQITMTEAELKHLEEEQAKGPWIVLYFSGLGKVFKAWNERISYMGLEVLLIRLRQRFPNCRLIFVGMPYDAGFVEPFKHKPMVEYMIGKTTFDHYFALLRGAHAAIGYANGNTIMTTHFDVPTLMLWSRDRYPNEGFWTNWVKPDAKYRPVDIEGFAPDDVVSALETLVKS